MTNALEVRYVTEIALPIETLIQQIEGRANKSDDHGIEAALLLVELRGRVDGGELGPDVKWMEWAVHNIKLSSSRLAELLAIGEAQDPHAELERLRRLNRQRQKTFREKNKREFRILEAEREDIIKWVQSPETNMDYVRKIRELVIKLELTGQIPIASPKARRKKRTTAKAGVA